MNTTFTTPIIDALKGYIEDQTVRFHMPGHKGCQVLKNPALALLGENAYRTDVTNVPGMDDLHQPHGIIREAERLAAELFGAEQTYFLINGSSCGLQALIMAACNPGDKILVPRNIHRSILSGIILSGAIPVFFLPEYSREYGIPLGTSPETVDRCLAGNPDAKAVLLVYPTYQGVISDVKTIAQVVHRYNIPLLIDEAHGPHFCFHEDLPITALEAGADASVQGTHKMLASFTQASMLHVKGNRLDRQRLEASLKLLQSTSTSYLLLASLDGTRAQMSGYGRELMGSALQLSGFLRKEIKKIPDYNVLGEEMIGGPGVFGLDPTKINISLKNLRISGLWAEQWLRKHHQIQVEMSDVFNLLLLVTCGNWLSDANKMLYALRDMIQHIRLHPEVTGPYTEIQDVNPFPFIPEMMVPPREAFLASTTPLLLEEAMGSISAEVITCYPPGIPVICPGEKFSQEIIAYLSVMRTLGIHFQGCSDAGLKTVLTLK
ncbi:aminotransferase class I/II-fold pyridoxal phosphate-dependent enzyme [Desulforamulus ruminis]|uniref:Orn/Lys/Arg decarboxylase major region n=1 Tax=Desulforamulus ruminis (strain ATCC 23193 / DSM 2154 / NCIMB 8452 / DL) TaxID=696281 RepID=F6DSJ8_DESRL|nr:aminotransferase class I/II-fold pyridoxal phosphate-dependent enzyme [Desulforamulus ruminis]AEG61088.1 Orn/Lys/Arg decarboxylase major region [Desulforamulus ruminis DSM 2154]